MRNIGTYTLLTGLVALIALPGSSQHPVKEQLRASIDKIIRFDTRIDHRTTPGFVVGIIDGDSTYTLAFGTRAPGSVDTITAQDRFEIGGLSKVLTSTLAAILEQRQIITLETAVNDALPDTYRNSTADGLTLEKLLTHTSGIPKYPPMFGDRQETAQDPYRSFSRTDLLESYRSLDLRKQDRFLYSHVNYALVENVLEGMTGSTYPELLQEHLFAPLGMASTSVDTVALAPGFTLSGKTATPWSFGSFVASEGLKSNLSDLLKFMRFSLDEAPETLWHARPHAIRNKRLSMGLGWYIVDQKRAPRIHAHTGHTDGHYAFAAMVRSTQTAVVILANTSAGVEDLGFLILRLINHNWKRKHLHGKKVQKSR